jgi:hypothetical protein
VGAERRRGKVTTAGKDGRLVIWNVAGKGLASRMGSLNI